MSIYITKSILNSYVLHVTLKLTLLLGLPDTDLAGVPATGYAYSKFVQQFIRISGQSDIRQIIPDIRPNIQ